MDLDVTRQRRHHSIGERHAAVGPLRLRWPERGLARLAGDELAVDGQLATQEVDPVDAEPGRFGLAQPGAEPEIERHREPAGCRSP